jgi:hypothetical protein
MLSLPKSTQSEHIDLRSAREFSYQCFILMMTNVLPVGSAAS